MRIRRCHRQVLDQSPHAAAAIGAGSAEDSREQDVSVGIELFSAAGDIPSNQATHRRIKCIAAAGSRGEDEVKGRSPAGLRFHPDAPMIVLQDS
jgi:hypothetical protein